jgi:hypothetical protein
LVRSRIARWACRSFARFLANCSGVRLATPRDEVLLNLRFRPAAVVDPPLSATGVSPSAEVKQDGVGEASCLTQSGS